MPSKEILRVLGMGIWERVISFVVTWLGEEEACRWATCLLMLPRFTTIAATWQNQQNECAPSGVFAVRTKKPWVLSCPLSTQRTLIRLGGSESSLGAHSFCLFSHVVFLLMPEEGCDICNLHCFLCYRAENYEIRIETSYFLLHSPYVLLVHSYLVVLSSYFLLETLRISLIKSESGKESKGDVNISVVVIGNFCHSYQQQIWLCLIISNFNFTTSISK